jgi:predicted transcriptional regulator
MVRSKANRVLLISVRPEFAARILDGSKTVELRRQLPKLRPGDLLALYITAPIKKLVATLRVAAVQSGSPQRLWRVVADYAAVSRQEYDAYFTGAKVAVAIFFSHVRQRHEALPLSKLRQLIDGFTAPRSYRYLCERERTALAI